MTNTPGKILISYNRDSNSLLRNSSHILQLTLQSVNEGSWAGSEGRFEKRISKCLFKVERLWKGHLESVENHRLVINISQYRPKGPRFIAVPGVWSGIELCEGANLVVFSQKHGNELRGILSETECRAAYAFSEIESDLELATTIPEEGMPLAMFVESIRNSWSMMGLLIGRYIASRFRELLFSKLEGYKIILGMIEDESIDSQLRNYLLIELCGSLLTFDEIPHEFLVPIISTISTVITEPGENVPTSPILDTYLPHLFGLEGSCRLVKPHELFDRDPKLKDILERLIAPQRGVIEMEKLVRWFDQTY